LSICPAFAKTPGATRNLEVLFCKRYNFLVRVFKNTWFIRFARKEGIDDAELRDIVKALEAGQADADLGVVFTNNG
jgi:hypothetical protein